MRVTIRTSSSSLPRWSSNRPMRPEEPAEPNRDGVRKVACTNTTGSQAVAGERGKAEGPPVSARTYADDDGKPHDRGEATKEEAQQYGGWQCGGGLVWVREAWVASEGDVPTAHAASFWRAVMRRPLMTRGNARENRYAYVPPARATSRSRYQLERLSAGGVVA